MMSWYELKYQYLLHLLLMILHQVILLNEGFLSLTDLLSISRVSSPLHSLAAPLLESRYIFRYPSLSLSILSTLSLLFPPCPPTFARHIHHTYPLPILYVMSVFRLILLLPCVQPFPPHSLTLFPPSRPLTYVLLLRIPARETISTLHPLHIIVRSPPYIPPLLHIQTLKYENTYGNQSIPPLLSPPSSTSLWDPISTNNWTISPPLSP